VRQSAKRDGGQTRTVGISSTLLEDEMTRRTLAFALIGAGCLVAVRLFAQDQPPNRREFTVTARDYRFSPSRIEVAKDDLVKLTVQSEDVAYSLTIDAYRLSRRIPAGGSAVIEFRADRAGSFPFYSNLTSDSRHGQMRGELVVSGR
jgi:heme/copper-type cytochrome/quinol oxidase subunit 2